MDKTPATRHIRLTSHSGGEQALPLRWDAETAAARGPVVGTTTNRAQRNVIGTHSGSYSVYRALAVAAAGVVARSAVGGFSASCRAFARAQAASSASART